MKIAFVFSGQGSQYYGMGKEFYDNFKTAQRVFEASSDYLQTDIQKLCFSENSKLHLTAYTQPAVLTVSHAIEAVMKDEGILPQIVGGLSLGEYTALVSANGLTFQDAIPLVNKRGSYMEEAVPKGKGKMSAIIGFDKNELETICRTVSENHYVTIANYNTSNQLVLSGETSGVELAGNLAKEAGAKRVVDLNVSGPFHSKLLQPAADLLEDELKGIPFNKTDYPVYSNVTADVYPDDENIRELLVKQMTSSVKFEQMVSQMIEDGTDTFIEIGPGKTLKSFIKSIDRNVTVKNVEKVRQLNKVISTLNK